MGEKKKEQITQIGKLEIKENNLSNLNDSLPKGQDDSKMKFYTSPDDILLYRNSYPYGNFSFTPQCQLNINDAYGTNQPYPMFPTIPNHYKQPQLTLEDSLFSENRTGSNEREE